MQKKYFKPTSIGGATSIVLITSLLSYIVGLLRDKMIAFNFGASQATDVYTASFIIPDMLFNLFIAGALMAAFMPIFSEYLCKDEEEAHKIANTMLTSATLLITTLAVLAFIFMRPIVDIFFSNIDEASKIDIINMTRLMLPSAILFAISNTLGNVLMTYKHFLSYSISPILYNLGIIIGIVLLNERLGIYSAATGVLIGAALHCVIRVIDTMNTKYRYKPALNIKSPAFKRIVKLMIPRSISLIAWQINLYLYALIGMQISEGGWAAFNFARNIQSLPVSMFGIAFATATFPYLSEAINNDDKKGFTIHIQNTVQRILFLTIPAMIGIMILSKDIVNIILSGGQFNEDAATKTAILLLFFSISIPFESLTQIFARSYYALKNTITPMIISLSGMSIIAAITYFIAPKFGIQWFTIGFSTGFIIIVLLQIILLSKHLKGFEFKRFFTTTLKTIIATGIMAISLLISSPLTEIIGPRLGGVAKIGIGALVFFIAASVMKIHELDSVKYALNKLRK